MQVQFSAVQYVRLFNFFIAISIFNMTLTLVLVFLPLYLMQPELRIKLKDFHVNLCNKLLKIK